MKKHLIYFLFLALTGATLMGCDSSSSSIGAGSTTIEDTDTDGPEPHPAIHLKFAPSADTSLAAILTSSTPLTANRYNDISLGVFKSNGTDYQPMAEPGLVTIYSQCAADGIASLTSSLDETAEDGAISSPLILERFQFRYKPSFNCVEDRLDFYFLSVELDEPLEESIEFKVEAPQPSSINFVNFSDGSLLRKEGTANPLLPEQTTATFVVIDSNGSPVGPGRGVSFTLVHDTVFNDTESKNSPIDLVPNESATSANSAGAMPRIISQRNFTNAAGEVSVTVAAGTDAISFYIGVDISSTPQTRIYSPQLTVTSGFPDRISVFRDEGDIDMDFVSYNLSVLLADRNGNPVPIGTIVRFEAPTSGVIDTVCETNERSQCSVTWSGSNEDLPTEIIAKTQREPGLTPLERRGILPKIEDEDGE